MKYSSNLQPTRRKQKRSYKGVIFLLVGCFSIGVLVFAGIQLFAGDEITIEEAIQNEIVFDSSVSDSERSIINSAITDQQIQLTDSVDISAGLASTIDNTSAVLDVYVPVTAFGSVRQSVTTTELKEAGFTVSPTIHQPVVDALVTSLAVNPANVSQQQGDMEYETIQIVPISELDTTYQLLTLDDSYYLDSFVSGAFFRTITMSGPGAAVFTTLSFDTALQTDSVYKVNLTGVTALTRETQKKLTAVGGDPLYFSAKIGDFLADADTTHVSNEVSFVENCPYSFTLFCSPPVFIETLKASGVDIVELTGNHNNDLGSSYNTSTIELYESLGWATIGGGLNAADAAEPHIVSMKQSDVAFLAYNYPDSPGGGAIAGVETAGANPFDFSFASIEADITAAKEKSDFVIVNVQYWECYAYPDGYIEFPQCDSPIGEQEATFKQLIDIGADMVVGSSAHQPQTYELYKGKPIYYGLGNLYFEQVQWPGTERGLVLTNYFVNGELLQTKITPTVYDRDLQTRVMTAEESAFLFNRLKVAR